MFLYTHPTCLRHMPSVDHPEKPDRVVDFIAACEEEFSELRRKIGTLATFEELAMVHDVQYLDILQKIALEKASLMFGEDTLVMSQTFEACRAAAGTVCSAVEDVCLGRVPFAFCAVRPPGHHAEKAEALGFCYVNNIVVAARKALEQKWAKRVVIFDFDIHHGNGTEVLTAHDDRILYLSSYEQDIFPYEPEEKSVSPHFCALPFGEDSTKFKKWFEAQALPQMKDFAPDILLVSAGFDGHYKDTSSSILWTDRDYTWIGDRLMDFARQFCEGRLVSVLEGGYNKEALCQGGIAYLKALKRT